MSNDKGNANAPHIGQTKGAAEAAAAKIVNTLKIICGHETNPTRVSKHHTPV